MDPTKDREYLIRITRNPLDPVQREQMREVGTLPEDYRSRQIEEHDFVNVTAASDEAACRRAMQETVLVFKGEKPTFHEVMDDGTWRFIGEIPPNLDIYEAV